jgi:hypothetical protein
MLFGLCRYQYKSHQQSNRQFLFPRILQAWGVDAGTATPSWSFQVEEGRCMCLQAFMWAYDAKHSTTQSMLAAVLNGGQVWLVDHGETKDGEPREGATSSYKNLTKAFHANSSYGGSLKQECWAYCKVWLRDCTAGDSCPSAGEFIEIDPVDHIEVYREYKSDMDSRGQGLSHHFMFIRC